MDTRLLRMPRSVLVALNCLFCVRVRFPFVFDNSLALWWITCQVQQASMYMCMCASTHVWMFISLFVCVCVRVLVIVYMTVPNELTHWHICTATHNPKKYLVDWGVWNESKLQQFCFVQQTFFCMFALFAMCWDYLGDIIWVLFLALHIGWLLHDSHWVAWLYTLCLPVCLGICYKIVGCEIVGPKWV